MCERLAGERGLPAPALAGCPQRRQRHRAAFSAGYERDTTGGRWGTTGYEQDTNRIRTGYESPAPPIPSKLRSG